MKMATLELDHDQLALLDELLVRLTCDDCSFDCAPEAYPTPCNPLENLLSQAARETREGAQ